MGRNPRFPWTRILVVAAVLSGGLLAASPAGASEPAGAAETAGGHGGGAHAEPGLNWTDFANRHVPPIVALVINFGVLLWILVHYGRAPVASFLAERRRTVEQEIDTAFEEKQRAQGKLRGAQMRAANLDEELMHLREDLLRVGFDERDRLIADAGARAEKIRREADFQAAEERRRAWREMRAQTVESAIQAAETTLREKLAPADHRKLADGFVRRIQEAVPK